MNLHTLRNDYYVLDRFIDTNMIKITAIKLKVLLNNVLSIKQIKFNTFILFLYL